MIPVFATAYASLPENSIYSSTRTLGDNFHQEGYNYAELSQTLDPLFEAAVREVFPNSVRWASPSISHIAIFNSEFLISDYTVQASDTFDRNEDGGEIGFTAKLYLPRKENYSFGSSSSFLGSHILGAYLDEALCARLSCESLGKALATYASTLSSGNKLLQRPPSPSATRVDMRMSDRQFILYTDLSYALDGNALGHYGRYSRALYLSATVITTLGFGDMVPVSDEARRFVILESVFGAIVIGLFLNAIATRAARIDSPDRKSP